MSRLVLDTSAIVAYAAGSVDVGEPISEVYSDGGRVIVPVVCLVEAARQASEEMLRVLGRLDLASALLLATTNDGYVLSGEPDSYGSLGEDSTIDF